MNTGRYATGCYGELMQHTATPAKLRDGSWGARIVGAQSPKAGETCTIRTSTGKTWDATIARVLWSGKDAKTGEPVALCTTASTEPRPRRDPVARRPHVGICTSTHLC